MTMLSFTFHAPQRLTHRMKSMIGKASFASTVKDHLYPLFPSHQNDCSSSSAQTAPTAQKRNNADSLLLPRACPALTRSMSKPARRTQGRRGFQSNRGTDTMREVGIAANLMLCCIPVLVKDLFDRAMNRPHGAAQRNRRHHNTPQHNADGQGAVPPSQNF